MPRRWPFENGKYYHVYNKSIFHFVIFNNDYEYQHMMNLMRYYQFLHDQEKGKFSRYLAYLKRNDLTWDEGYFEEKESVVEISAYCLMPTHVHFVLKQLKDAGIEQFMRKTLSSYSHYFNLRYERKGPLWQNRFQAKLVDDLEGGTSFSRLLEYVHNNPVKANLVRRATDWAYSSAFRT